MGLIPEEHKQHLKEEFEKNLKDDVRIVMFTQHVRLRQYKKKRGEKHD